ncbi:unnamed protein product, partial [Prorocentrum cordatum]
VWVATLPACRGQFGSGPGFGRRRGQRRAVMVGPACTPSTLLASVCLVFGGGFWWDKTHNSTLSGKFNPFQNQLGPGLEEPAQPERVEESEGAPTGQPVPEAHTDSLEEAPAQQRAEQSETAGDARAPVETLATQDASTKDRYVPVV